MVGLSPEGRGQLEAVVSIPNDFLERIPAPQGDDMRALTELSPTGAKVSKKCASLANCHNKEASLS